MLTETEKTAIDRLRHGAAGMDRAIVALLVDHDADLARRNLCEEEVRLRRFFERSLPPQPGRFGFSPCDIATLAACDVLCHPPTERKLEPLTIAFDPAVANVNWNGCPRSAVEPALALIAWLLGDVALCGRHLVRSRPDGVVDRLLTEVTSLLFRDRGSEIGRILASLGPEYTAAMGQGLWRSDPDAFVHVRVLAALKVGAERGCVDLSELSDTLPYVPLWFLRGSLQPEQDVIDAEKK